MPFQLLIPVYVRPTLDTQAGANQLTGQFFYNGMSNSELRTIDCLSVEPDQDVFASRIEVISIRILKQRETPCTFDLVCK